MSQAHKLTAIQAVVDQKLAFGNEVVDCLLQLIKRAETELPGGATNWRVAAKGWAVGRLVPEISQEATVSLIVALLDRLEKAEGRR